MGIGKIDFPVDHLQQDHLSLNLQINGFADFIMHCDTPMAIAIQGAWGSGKTSFVNLVMDKIHSSHTASETPYEFISFNVWQYSQFGLGEQLPLNLLTSLIQEIRRGIPQDSQEGNKAADEIRRSLRSLRKVSVTVANDLLKKATDLDMKSYIDMAIQEYTGNKTTPEPNQSLDALKSLRSNFQKAINERLDLAHKTPEEQKNSRIILFVDDLDRLSPDKAVEVLEILKIFLDCEHCVFLLAIDYEVVLNGINIKYHGTLNAQKGSDFFEKMIQVVYNMPKSLDHTDRYIASMLTENHINRSASIDFAKLIKAGNKDNPRTIKRLVNSFLLLAHMRQAAYKSVPIESHVALFAMLCLQSICPELYDYLLARQDDLPLEFLNQLKTAVFSRSYQSSPLSVDRLHHLGLVDASGKMETTKWNFLQAFFEQIIECDFTNQELGNFDYTIDLSENHKEVMASALHFTEITHVKSNVVTEEDCVAFIIADCELWSMESGTVSEAFAYSCQYLLSSFDEEELPKALELTSLVSTQPDAFAHYQKIDAPVMASRIPVYVNLDGSISTMLRELNALGKYNGAYYQC